MAELRVVNASPVIVLAKVGAQDSLVPRGGSVILPNDVGLEILAAPPEDPARQLVERGWADRVEVPLIPARVLEWGLGRGESSVLAFLLERPDGVAILDDAKARSCARTLGVRAVGTLGVILLAKREGRIGSAKALVLALRQAGFRIADEILARVLKEVDETWP